MMSRAYTLTDVTVHSIHAP